MKHLTSYKIFENHIKPNDPNDVDLSMVKDYIKDTKNFPELDNIKEILQGLSDYCFLYTKPVKYWVNLHRINDLKFGTPISIRWDIIGGLNYDYQNEIYYKSYCVYISLPKFWDKKFTQQLDLAKKRLENCGYCIIKFRDKIIHRICIYAVDKNDPVTMEDIKNWYDETSN